MLKQKPSLQDMSVIAIAFISVPRRGKLNSAAAASVLRQDGPSSVKISHKCQ